MIDWDSMDTATLERALRGDMKPLIQKLRSGQTLRQEERNFLADRLEGKKTLKPGRKEKIDRLDLDVYLARRWLIEIDGQTPDNAIIQIAGIVGENHRTIYKRLKRAEVNFQFEMTLGALSRQTQIIGFMSAVMKHRFNVGSDDHEFIPRLLVPDKSD